jgi:hypothetical protein
MLYLQSKGFKFEFGHVPDDPQFWWLYGLGFLVNLFLLSAVLVRQRTLILGQAPDLRHELQFAAKKLPLLALTWLLSLAGIMVGTIAFVVPAIYLGICLSVLQCVVLFDPVPEAMTFSQMFNLPPRAIVRSVKLVHPFWWRCCAALVIGLLVSFLCILAASAVLALIVNVTGTAASNEGRAIQTAIGLGFDATAMVFYTSLSLVLYSAANNSA